MLLLNIVFNISKQFLLVDFRSLAVILLEVVTFLGVCWISSVLFNRGSRGSRAIVPPVPSWVQNLFSWVFYWSVIFCRGYFVFANLFLMGVLLIQYFFLWVFRGSKFFSLGICGSESFLVLDVSWLHNFLMVILWVEKCFLWMCRR